MLASMGLSSLDELFEVVPAALRLATGLDLPDGRSEFEVLDELEVVAGRNRTDLVCFAGGGAYDHDIPSAVKRVAFRSEFVTAYTPYQPEVAQGVLQALFEYQTMIARLSGLEVANASLYDGATACVEAINLAVAATGRQTVWLSDGVHPTWRDTVRTFAAGTGHDIVDVPLVDGRTAWPETGEPGALLVQFPNRLGCIEDLAEARKVADRTGALLLVAFDPVASGLLRTPGSFGADVVVGEGQPFGTPLSFGGPYLGLFACRLEHVRRLPGRLVGETVDVEGRRAYVTTLRTREQDIRREKASSNVCTNQTLIAVVCAIQLSFLGTAGLRELALRCARAARYTRDSLLAIDGIEPLAGAPTFREFAVRLPIAGEVVVDRMAEEGFLAGIPTEGGLIVAATEKRTRSEIDAYADAMRKVLQ
jgi:glycine dehydrogenase subunit 1